MDSALSGAGKRAAFAMFYAPLHFLLIQAALTASEQHSPAVDHIVDLGCGTGVAAAAWALQTPGKPRVTGIERHRWAIAEARWTWRSFGIPGHARQGDLTSTPLPGEGAGIIAAFTVNELDEPTRDQLRERLLAAAAEGAEVWIVEPIARRRLRWWDKWQASFEAAGGSARTLRVQAQLPEKLRLMDRAAGLDHRELTGRTLHLPSRK